MSRTGFLQKTFTYNGKRYYIYGKTEKECYEKMAEKKAELKANKVQENNITVKQWALKVVDVYKPDMSDIVREKYMNRMNHCIFEEIGSKKLKAVTPLDVQKVMNLQIGKSNTQINAVYGMLKFIFGTAEDNGKISKSPATSLIKPKGYTESRRAITDEEKKALLECAIKNDNYNMFVFMLKCGCRPSEAREIKHNDFFLYEGVPFLHIRGTKTEKADRNVPCPKDLFDKYCSKEDKHIFLNARKEPFTLKAYTMLTKRLYRDMNIAMGCEMKGEYLIPPYPLKDDFTPYCLRHTYATELARKVDILTLQKLLGHTTVKTLSKFYVHLDNSDLLKVVEYI